MPGRKKNNGNRVAMKLMIHVRKLEWDMRLWQLQDFKRVIRNHHPWQNSPPQNLFLDGDRCHQPGCPCVVPRRTTRLVFGMGRNSNMSSVVCVCVYQACSRIVYTTIQFRDFAWVWRRNKSCAWTKLWQWIWRKQNGTENFGFRWKIHTRHWNCENCPVFRSFLIFCYTPCDLTSVSHFGGKKSSQKRGPKPYLSTTRRSCCC